jgi:hypothetical protein
MAGRRFSCVAPGVLKGSGVARGITVPRGHVIQALGLIDAAPMRPQSFFHPRPGA